MSRSLVILESPAKCGKIEQFLGPDCVCLASYGHIRELRGLDAVAFDDTEVHLSYTVIGAKAKQVAKLKAAAKRANEVILATDDDREGEAIAWHIREVLGLPAHTKRIVFHEITCHAVLAALAAPRTVDMARVRAQQAREVIDLTVGFRVSPVLWQKLCKRTKRGLSAGRCQTPALRLVAENDVEVRNVRGTVVYSVVGIFTRLSLPFKLTTTFPGTDEVEMFLQASAKHSDYVFCRGSALVHADAPPRPFTTSTLQQAASTQLRMSPKRAMSVCQALYEAGHITYMRTDSDCMAPEFVTAAAGTVRMMHGEPFVGADLHALSQRGAGAPGAQEAHEAIRPTHVGRVSLGQTAAAGESRMYELIWKRAVGACMAPAELQRVKASVAGPTSAIFVHTAEEVAFAGWKALDGPAPDAVAFRHLLTIKNGSQLPYMSICAAPTLRGAKLRFAEAGLVKQLEARGIGRPSTFASLVAKLQERGYAKVQDVAGREAECREYRLEPGSDVAAVTVVKKVFGAEKRKLVLQPLGRMVIDILTTHFESLFRYDYTADMESRLDEVAAGSAEWEAVCTDCRDDVARQLAPLGAPEKGGITIDAQHTYIVGRHGPVIKKVAPNGEVTFKGVRKDVDMDRLRAGNYTLDELEAASQPARVLGRHEGETVTLKVGRYGPYVEWKGARRSVSAEVGAPDELTLESVLPLLSGAGARGTLRELDRHTSIRTGPNGDYVFHKRPGWKRPRFYPLRTFIAAHGKDSYKTCDHAELATWLQEEHHVSLVA
jgi:DNA topoisomerase-1